MSYQLVNKCRLCKCKDLNNVLELSSTPIGDDYLKVIKYDQKKFPIKLLKCSKCNFVQLSVNIDPNEVYGDYLYVTKTSSGLPEHFKSLVNFLEKKKIVFKNAKVLEIGCNDGTLLEFLNKKKCEVVGVDPASKIVKKLKFNIYKGLYNFSLSKKISNKHGNFDLIVANNVIANIDNLDDIFRALNNNLNLNGNFVMETFSLHGLLKNNLLDNIYHEHISYISLEPIKKFAKKYGLYLRYANHLKVKGGSLRLIFSKKKPSKNERLILSKIIKKENLVVKKKNIFKKLAEQNDLNRKKIFNFIKQQHDMGKTIYGYGASVGTTTNIYYLNITKYVNAIFDDEGLRHDLYLPGTGIKVISPKKIKKISPDIIIIFAWRYYKLIMPKIKNLNGVQVVIPLPKMKKIK